MIMSQTLATILILLGIAIVSYLLGSVSFAIIYTKIFSGVDVRDFGSKNAGMTNVARVAGKKAAVLTLICDVGKGVVAVLLAKYFAFYLLDILSGGIAENYINPLLFAYLAGFCCILGHLYPVFFSFRGGKGVASMLGIVLVIDWRVALIALLIFLIVLAFTRMVSASSMSAALTLPITTFLLYDSTIDYLPLLGISQQIIITLCALLFTIIIFFTHRSNIVRIIHGEEKKIGHKKSEK